MEEKCKWLFKAKGKMQHLAQENKKPLTSASWKDI